jgi:hypothetical protein
MNDTSAFDWTQAQPTRFELFGPISNTAVILADFVAMPETTEEKFRRLRAEWEDQTINLSSLDEMFSNAAYKAIIEMGKPALPYLFTELKTSPHHWFYALRKITGEDPIPKSAAGNLQKMASAWLKWGRKSGII